MGVAGDCEDRGPFPMGTAGTLRDEFLFTEGIPTSPLLILRKECVEGCTAMGSASQSWHKSKSGQSGCMHYMMVSRMTGDCVMKKSTHFVTHTENVLVTA